MSADLKLYAAVMGKHAPRAAFAALGEDDNPHTARALVVASHKGLAMRAAESAGVKVNLNGWRVASPQAQSWHAYGPDVRALLRSQVLHGPRPGDVLLSRPLATDFVARWHHGVQRWTRVARFIDGQAVLLPGAIDEFRWGSDSRRWQIDAGAWRARVYYGGERYGEWLDLDTVLLCNHFDRRAR